MALAITEEQRALAGVAREFLRARGGLAPARDSLDTATEELPDLWDELADLGWLGLAVPEEYGGQGGGLPELAILAEEMGRCLTPGPFLPTVLAASVLAEAGSSQQCGELLPGLAAGTTLGAVAVNTLHAPGVAALTWETAGVLDGTVDVLDGTVDVLGAGQARVLLLPVGQDLAIVPADAAGLHRETPPGLDPTRRLTRVTCAGVAVDPSAVIADGRPVAARLLRTLAAAEAAGSAHACAEMAAGYAGERVQFGRPIGTFQAVKHRCADMLVAAWRATAAAWDAARPSADDPTAGLAAAIAAETALPAAIANAEGNIQVHGGIGCSWEHDAHLYARRCRALAAVVAAGGATAGEIAAATRTGLRRRVRVDLPARAERHRPEAAEAARRVRELAPERQREELARSGFLVPHWPRPWGLAADPAQQLVIEEEFAGVATPTLGVTGWVVRTIVEHGTREQCERWVMPALEGRLTWCQLFSEPEAGSDAAAVTTRAHRAAGGWLVTGQKVWTTGAAESDMGLATVRTGTGQRKHAGLTVMAIDLRAENVTVRPLRELTGEARFAEVSLEGVFVSDADVIGEVGEGWSVARATLGNERVAVGGGGVSDVSAFSLLDIADQVAPGGATGWEEEIGSLIAAEQTARLVNAHRAAVALEGAGAGAGGAVTKLIEAEHDQRVAALAMEIAGTRAVTDQIPGLSRAYLFNRALTVAGGTSEVIRNQIAERMLGLPRDPLLR
ncbi:acyl-CoA dehydrogenase [Salinactinospora qingdaonensis]|uniref:Acyl-CoA dehydrogenase n=1 Tax=Salinactinospora qingdaonensis TaxID=702744 RepID=A0ABP7FAZ7_9ACTN